MIESVTRAGHCEEFKDGLTLCSVLDFPALLHALASSRFVAAGGLNTVDCVDATLRQALAVLEVKPLDRSEAVVTRAGSLRGISLIELCDLSKRTGQQAQSVEGEDGRVDLSDHVEEVMSSDVLIALRHKTHIKNPRLAAQGEGKG